MARILSFSGVDGSGKSTQARQVARQLSFRGIAAIYCVPTYRNLEAVRSHCDSVYGSRYAYASKFNPNIYMGALISDWLHWKEADLPQVPDEMIICMDRYAPDVMAQSVSHGADFDSVALIMSTFPPTLRSYFMSIAPKLAGSRLNCRSADPRNEIETDQGLHLLAEGYARAASIWPMTHIDASVSADEITEDIISDIETIARTVEPQ